MTNCRPISLPTVLSKVFKQPMNNGVSQLLHTNNILVLGMGYQLKMLPWD